ncbi:MAG: heavy metal translocating P-type ATPase [bacterium]
MAKNLNINKNITESVKDTYSVEGMSCASCAISVESMLKAQTGVVSANVNYATSSVTVDYQPEVITPKEFKSIIQSIGYDLLIDESEIENESEKQKNLYQQIRRNAIWAVSLSLPVFLIAMFFMNLPYGNWIMLVLTTPVVFWFGRTFFIHAAKQAKHGKANMDTLVALSTSIAYFFSAFNTIYPEFWHNRGLHAHVYFEASAVVISFILIGKLLEERAKSNASSAIKKLFGLQPKTVTKIVNGEQIELPISSVKIDDILLIKPGDKIPVDGEVTYGNSFVDESTITGEPIAVEKIIGDKVFAGTINQKGSFQIIARKVGGDTILSQIIETVRNALMTKPPVQKLVDKIAGIFVPIVITISILTFFIWLIFDGNNSVNLALLSMVTVLVIACPCALGLATPTAIMVGVGKGADLGILIKDSDSLELAHKIDAIVLDKTGTITEGKPHVTDFLWHCEDKDLIKYKEILQSMELLSEHPLAEAVLNSLRTDELIHIQTEEFASITGRGIEAKYNNDEYFIGNHKLLMENGINISELDADVIGFLQKEAKTIVYFADKNKLIATIAIADKIKHSSAKAISILKDEGIEVYLLTGDNELTAKAVAHQVGITNYKAEVLPGEKADFIKELQKQNKIVAMVGDGINDSQALALADVGIAMGRGSDIAMDVAKITIISSDLMLIPKAIKLSSLTLKTIKQNLFWAFIYNLIGIPIAAGILYPFTGFLLNPMIAGAAMALSSFSVVSNSIRMRSKKI